MLVREAKKEDCKIIFNWRTDPLSQKMFFDSSEIDYEKHIIWYENSLINPLRQIYIGEIKNKLIGICRFDYIKIKKSAEVSININPLFRGKGLGKKFLVKSIQKYFLNNDHILNAKIKKNNTPSLIICQKAVFIISKDTREYLNLTKPLKDISFKSVNINHVDLLYQLLSKRENNISHNSMPTYENHKQFVSSNPYRYWYLIYEGKEVIGNFYLKDNNSIGMNVLNPSLRSIKKVCDFIKKNFQINNPLPSSIPPYFYINVAESNKNFTNTKASRSFRNSKISKV